MLENKRANTISAMIAIIVIFCVVGLLTGIFNAEPIEKVKQAVQESFTIISSTENEDLEPIIQKYAKNKGYKVKIEYAGTIEIMDKLNSGEKYDAVWTSNSIWLYMLDSKIKVTNSKSTSITPVVFGVKKAKAEQLGWIGKSITTKDILEAIKNKQLKFNMSSATQTNTGATAYLGFLTTLAGNPEILKESDLESEQLKVDLVDLFSGVVRSSGSDEFLEDMFFKGDYDAVVTYETSLIHMNKKLETENKEPLYILYPEDGVSLSDSPFAYIDQKNKEKLAIFQDIQGYLLSKEGQAKLMETGRRVWYGGINNNADKTVFNPNWGIDTNKYIVPVKYPSTTVIKKALALYQSELRKPSHIVFCLDYSGSMYGKGIEQLTKAMQYILTEEEASKNMVQFSEKDKITIIPFSSNIIDIWNTDNGLQTHKLLSHIQKQSANGGTNIYEPAQKAIEILKAEEDKYSTSIVLMTDGMSNAGTYRELKNSYQEAEKEIPIFSIMFGEASSSQLQEIAVLTNAKVFDGRTNLLEAFKQVRGYN